MAKSAASVREFTIPAATAKEVVNRGRHWGAHDHRWRLDGLPAQVRDVLRPVVQAVHQGNSALADVVMKERESPPSIRLTTEDEGRYPIVIVEARTSRVGTQIEVRLGANAQGRYGYTSRTRTFVLTIEPPTYPAEVDQPFTVKVSGNYAGIEQAIREIVQRRLLEDANVAERERAAKVAKAQREQAVAAVQQMVHDRLVPRFRLDAPPSPRPHVYSWKDNYEEPRGTYHFGFTLKNLRKGEVRRILDALGPNHTVTLIVEDLPEERAINVLSVIPPTDVKPTTTEVYEAHEDDNSDPA